MRAQLVNSMDSLFTSWARVIPDYRLVMPFTIFLPFLTWVKNVLPIFHFTMLADLLLSDDKDQK